MGLLYDCRLSALSHTQYVIIASYSSSSIQPEAKSPQVSVSLGVNSIELTARGILHLVALVESFRRCLINLVGLLLPDFSLR